MRGTLIFISSILVVIAISIIAVITISISRLFPWRFWRPGPALALGARLLRVLNVRVRAIPQEAPRDQRQDPEPIESLEDVLDLFTMTRCFYARDRA